MPKLAKVLTDRQVRGIKRDGFHPVGIIPGLGLKVAGNARSWILRTTTGQTLTSSTGRQYAARRDRGLGGYPDVSLEEARRRAAEIRRKLRDGIDLDAEEAAAKATQAAQQAARVTFAKAAKECHKVRSAEFANARHREQWLSSLEQYAFPLIGKKPVGELSAKDVLAVLEQPDPVTGESFWLAKHETATRVRQRMEAAFRLAIANEWRTSSNPAALSGSLGEMLPKSRALSKRRRVRSHARTPIDRLPALMAELARRGSNSALALQFAILTAARSGEVRHATWSEIDLDSKVWTVPAERMKAGKEHQVPLSAAACAILRALPHRDGLLFTNSKVKALSDAALSKYLKDLHAGGFDLIDPDCGRVATPHGTARSTFKDWAENNDIRDELSELALAHVNSDATRAAYARDKLLKKRRSVMEQWGVFCAGRQV